MRNHDDRLYVSPFWKLAVLLVLIVGFGLLSLVTVKTYAGAPPIPAEVRDLQGRTLFTRADIEHGQDVFFKYALMEHGTLWGHGAYLGPDYAAEDLHRLAEIGRDTLAQAGYGRPFSTLPLGQALEIGELLKLQLKQNRYQRETGILTFTAAEEASHRIQAAEWRNYFNGSTPAPGLPGNYIKDEGELQHLNDYLAWATWATVALRPGTSYSYTNNWPYEPLVGNLPTGSAYLWSALSLISLLGGLGLILFIFGKFEYPGVGRRGRPGRRQAARGMAPHPEPEGAGPLFCGGDPDVPDAGDPGRRHRPLPDRAGRFLWFRPGPDPAL